MGLRERRYHNTMGDLETIAPIFGLIGVVMILGYLIPVILGHIDDARISKTQTNKQTSKNL